MGWEVAAYAVALGVMYFIMFGGLQSAIAKVMDSKVKIAEAHARAEEAKLEQKKLDHDSRTSA